MSKRSKSAPTAVYKHQSTCEVPSWPVDDVSALEIVKGQHQLTDEEFHSAFLEPHVLLEMVTQVPSKQQVYNHEHIFFILEWVPKMA